MITLSLTQH